MSSSTNSKIKERLLKLATSYLKDDSLIEISIDRVLDSDVGSIEINSIFGITVMITGESGNYFIGGHDRGQISRCLNLEYEDWDHKYSVSTYGQEMAKTIKRLEKTYENLKFLETDNSGDVFMVSFSVEFKKGTRVKDGLGHIQQLEDEMKGHTEIMLDFQDISKDVLKDEKKFSLTVLLPLFRGMHFQNVQYNHGPREFGRDIIFTDIDRLGIRRDFGVQAKVGDLTGEAKSELDILIGQIDDAFEIEYINTFTKEKKHITDLIVAISGKFTGNAPQKIHEKTCRRKNVHFFDIDKIQELLMKYMSKKIQ